MLKNRSIAAINNRNERPHMAGGRCIDSNKHSIAGDAALAALNVALTKAPEWTTDLPLACECGLLERYEK